MAISLQDQLLNSGLIKKDKANKAKKEKYKQSKQQRNSKTTQTDEATLLAQKTLSEKQAKDRELNQQQKLKADKKAIIAQIKQLIKLNIQAKDNEGIAYNFSDNNVVKKIYVNDATLKNISNGRLAIVKYDTSYELVPAQVAEKIKQRDASFILVLNDKVDGDITENDPYADFQIPDDLMW
ncbi:conserved hypothetical protein [Bathymodiolus platifrons methanotrophic gill symbiont]|uniref:DUF2058 domain-containing protein n=1 Tax=Bathymodiolus platifrons methanotrophic gill symbiont TaxID=113268 RepID=UPI000B407D34|nr:DUF2058 domain-containing protein [Bathymodiolus platifrons methanotrophic gill symbiont]MCK5870521.1 DUF2058 domain-containing protein [Methyloprofundus sp.]TXK95435.1 DUF2058 domain-containing protein [Methylococcaceae bacterium CS4]TXK99812.1 DUF2058 domain-containing protein [Methylococcaceae bacterium CS5]TXL01558.1 DUF2058 domain-containing protein [Methylococcaceae bacterium HT1]TXL06438.1 DUF2058 domain-containing protein [Methylococcaceae bacterium CS1]TXL07198.1 DUF2058 domain-co